MIPYLQSLKVQLEIYTVFELGISIYLSPGFGDEGIYD